MRAETGHQRTLGCGFTRVFRRRVHSESGRSIRDHERCFVGQLTLYEGLSNVTVVLDYAAQAGMEMKSQRLHSILVKLHHLGVETTGLRVPLAQLHKPLLERFAQRAGISQYPVIPTRIYHHFLSTCEHNLGIAAALSDYLARVYAGESQNIPAVLVTAAAHFGCKDSPYIVSSLVASINALCQLVILSFMASMCMCLSRLHRSHESRQEFTHLRLLIR